MRFRLVTSLSDAQFFGPVVLGDDTVGRTNILRTLRIKLMGIVLQRLELFRLLLKVSVYDEPPGFNKTKGFNLRL